MKSWKACKVDGLDMIDYFSKTKEKGTKKGENSKMGCKNRTTAQTEKIYTQF